MYNTYDFSVTLGSEDDNFVEADGTEGEGEAGAANNSNSFDVGGSDIAQEAEAYNEEGEELSDWFSAMPGEKTRQSNGTQSRSGNGQTNGNGNANGRSQDTSNSEGVEEVGDWFTSMYPGKPAEVDN